MQIPRVISGTRQNFYTCLAPETIVRGNSFLCCHLAMRQLLALELTQSADVRSRDSIQTIDVSRRLLTIEKFNTFISLIMELQIASHILWSRINTFVEILGAFADGKFYCNKCFAEVMLIFD